MSNDIRLNVDFMGNLKTRKLIRCLGTEGLASILRLWLYVAKHHPRGQMNGMAIEDVEDIAGWTGERGVFASYTTRTGWVDQSEDGHLSIHDWKEHQGWLYHSESRSNIARANVEARWEKYRKQRPNTTRIRPVYKPNTEGNTPSPSPSPSPEGQSLIVTRKRFTIPTVEEVEEYCKARGNTVDPLKFHAYYTSNGWKVGKNPMKNWKAAVVSTWERR